MFLMYIDESGDAGALPYSPTRFFVLSGLVVHESRWNDALNALIDFRKMLNTRFGFRLREEFHASELINSPGTLDRIKKHDRLEILRLYADQLAALQYLNLINVVVDKQGKASGYDVFEMAWKALIQRFENTIASKRFPVSFKDADEQGMLIPDATDDKKLRQLLRKMRRYNPISNQSQYGIGSRNLQLRRVIEDPFLKDSKESFFIQSADLAAYLLYQHLTPNAYMRKKSGQNYFNRLDPILCKVASSKDPKGVVRL